jgi:hypothetical protein
MNMSPNDLPRVPCAAPDRVTMPDFRAYQEAMYSQDKPEVRVQKPQAIPVYLGYEEDLPVRDRRPAILLGLGLAAGVLIGAAVFFMIMPGLVPTVEKKVEVAKVETPPPVAPPVNMNAPVVVEAPPPIVVAPIVVTAPAFTLPRAEINSLLSRAKNAIAEGDISLARSFLERAAKTNDATALLMLGETYDADSLKTWGARGVKADSAKARDYYTKSADAGDALAKTRLERLR